MTCITCGILRSPCNPCALTCYGISAVVGAVTGVLLLAPDLLPQSVKDMLGMKAPAPAEGEGQDKPGGEIELEGENEPNGEEDGQTENHASNLQY